MSTITIDRISSYDTRTRPTRHLRAVPGGQDPAVQSRAVQSPAAVRLTRRGKAVVLAVSVAVIALLAIALGSSSTATGEAGAPQQTTSVRVMPGHTLWQIAADANPDGDIRDTVDDIIRLNSLPNASALQMGTEIAVPVYDR